MRIFSLCLFFVISSCQSSNDNLSTIVSSIVEVNNLHYKHVGIAGVTSEQYLNFEKLKAIATEEKLVKLTKHKNGVIQCYAVWALADSRYNQIEEIFVRFIEDNKDIHTFKGCQMLPSSTSTELYFAIQSAKYFSMQGWQEDSLFYIQKTRTLDSIVINHPHSNDFLKKWVTPN